MGFTTGFLGGLTLTYSVLYLTIYLHKANRNVQRTLLNQSHTLLNSVVEPLPPLPETPAYEVREAGLVELLKDRWNSEVEKLVRNVQDTDWREKREQAEERISQVWGRVRETDAAREVEGRVREGMESAKEGVKQGVASVRDGVAGVKDEAKNLAQGAKSGARDAKKEVVNGKRLLEQ